MILQKLRKVTSYILLVVVILMLVGCGHSLYHKVQGTGVYGRIPTPNGGSLIEVAIGDMSITSGILRGGATLDEHSSKGGTFGSVSIAKHTHIATVPAMNQGNVRDVLVSPDVDAKTKQKVAEYLVTRQQIPVPPATVTSVNSAAATGEKGQIPEAKPTKIGMDNVVDKVAQVAPPVVESIATNTAQTVQKVAPPVVESIATNTAQTVQKVSGDIQKGTESFFDNIKMIWVWIICGIVFIVVVIVLLCFYYKHKKNKKQEQKTEEVKTEEVKTEEVKTEEVKTEDVKTEDVKTEEVK